MSNSYSEKISPKDAQDLKLKLEASGYTANSVQHSLWGFRGEGVVVTYYKSGKLLVQGNRYKDFIAKYGICDVQQPLIEVPAKKITKLDHGFDCWIGTDESGKGDYFGPLVVASVMVDNKNKFLLQKSGVADSKKLSDERIIKLAAIIKNNSVFSVVVINPKKYNQLYDKFKNLNKMLAWGHARVIENILEKTSCENVISDKFADESLIKNALMKCGRSINLVQETKGERDLAVAAASILAREEFVKRMNYLSRSCGFELSKGASDKVVMQANKLVQGKFKLPEFAKLHFKITNKVKIFLQE